MIDGASGPPGADEPLGASFRDPSGFVFTRDGVLYRQVNRGYAAHYDQLLASGLYADLVARGLLIPHAEEPGARPAAEDAYRVLRPDRVAFVSYPYEWSFSQLRDAAELTLEVQRRAQAFGMTLKDASAFNVQLLRGRPVWIDTLSFEIWREGSPWVPYRQFCQHFLAPLALVAHRDPRLGSLSREHLDGVPLDLASALLPLRAWLDPHLLLHLRIHARFQRRHAGRADAGARARRVGRRGLEGLVAALASALRRLRPPAGETAWSGYGEAGSYPAEAAAERRTRVVAWLEQLRPASLLDLGANTGAMSRLASGLGIPTVALDADPVCVDAAWRQARAAGDPQLLPLVVDLTNPSPALGFAHAERAPLVERFRAGAVMALALVHHLAIANNVPLPRLAAWLAELGPELLVEWVPKSDPRVRQLLATREDVFADYTREGFERAFAARFETLEAAPLRGSERVLYRMRRRPEGGN
jgi:SAM-dependent methyltransferase